VEQLKEKNKLTTTILSKQHLSRCFKDTETKTQDRRTNWGTYCGPSDTAAFFYCVTGTVYKMDQEMKEAKSKMLI
jgi:hypothetical protein